MGTDRLRGYFAAPLFNEAERRFNKFIARRLELYADIFLPQRDGGLLLEMVKQGISPANAERAVFQCDIEAMQRADFLIAVLDGNGIDEGVAFEIGYMHCLGKPCFGFQTDVRRALPTGNNPMLIGALGNVFLELKALEEALSYLASDSSFNVNPSRSRERSIQRIA